MVLRKTKKNIEEPKAIENGFWLAKIDDMENGIVIDNTNELNSKGYFGIFLPKFSDRYFIMKTSTGEILRIHINGIVKEMTLEGV